VVLLSMLAVAISLGINIFAQPLIQDFNIALPNHTSRIETGEILTVKWTNYSYSARNISRLNIYIVKGDNIIYTVAKNIFNNGKYVTKLPSDFNPGQYRIKITSVDEASFALSEVFRIIAEIPIKIIKPDFGSVWKQGSECKIKWSAKGDKVYINLLKVTKAGESTSRLKIADAIENKGEYLWHIPRDLEDGSYMVAIRIPPIKEIKHSMPFAIRKLEENK